ncbi:alpha/beta hydrolase [Geodermatophilaceae bacterium NBWT11]|nr:alpha/beta hydrolase [Geodermatophilaceae bacterium NBWT11]
MDPAPRRTGTRHLVDPEIADPLDSFPPFDLTAESLPAVRRGMAALQAGRPDPRELFPAVLRTEERVRGVDGGPDVPVRLYRTGTSATPTAGLVWFHGGGFVMGTAADDDLMCSRLAAETGAVVVSVDYRLAPETVAPGPVMDGYAALAWLAGHAEQLGVHPARLAVGGASAGGGVAAAVAVLARDRGEIPLALQLLVYPMLDDRTASSIEPPAHAGEFVWTARDNRFGWAALLGRPPGGPDTSPYAAAARAPDVTGLPPTFLAVGALDLFLEEDVEFARRLIRAGVPTELHVYPGCYHGFTMVPTARVSTAHDRNVLAALSRLCEG